MSNTKFPVQDDCYSTTRLLTTEKPEIVKNLEDMFETVLFLPEGEGRKGEGGLRTKGYFKKSFRDKPLITVITVVYNGETYLEETIQSVINQTYDNVEYIIIDGGSTDGTLDIIKKYEAQIDYWVSERDEGIYDAMNKALCVKRGDWVSFLGSDDILYDILHSISKNLKPNLLMVYGDAYMPKRHILYLGKFSKLKLVFNNICQQAILYNSNHFHNNKFSLTYRYLSDYEFNVRMFDKKTSLYLPVLFSRYNDINGSSEVNNDIDFMNDKLKIIYKNFGWIYYCLLWFIKVNGELLGCIGLKHRVKRLLKMSHRM